MSLHARRVLAATALTALLVAAPASAAPAATTSARAGTPPAGAAGTTITLVTGDVVTVHQAGGGTTLSAGGAVHVVETPAGTYAYPVTALPYVASGLLDRELFNVSQLIADGYDDAHSDHLPLIVRYAPGAALRSVAPVGATMVRTLPAVHGAAVAQDRDRAGQFWSTVRGASARKAAGGIEHIWLDGRVHADLVDTTAQVNAPQVWARGDVGAGVTVAVLDTGVDPGHPDLTDRIAGTNSFVPGSDVLDRTGHGTHVASTIAGTGAASAGQERGVAPGARLDIGKVLGDDGIGQDSWVIAGMQWAAVDRGARIVNMSLGGGEASDGHDALSAAVDSLSAQTGALFVVAAGNSGAPSSIPGPGAADAALTVGAVDRDDNLAVFSSQGPRVGDQAIKPEITAPGVDVLAARSSYAEGTGPYVQHSGTSMATPHVAGAAALVLAAHPGWTGRQLKDALVSTSAATPRATPWQGGTGRLDAAAAATATVFATGAVSAGARQITYTNTGVVPVTLRLTASGGFVTLPADEITVPAGGTATTTLSVLDTPVNRAGFVTATGPDGRVLTRTSVATGPVQPVHRLTLKVLDRAGKPVEGVVELLGQSDGYDPMFLVVEGETTMLLPAGNYSALGFADVPGVHGPQSRGLALLGAPSVDLDHDTTVALDASRAREMSAVVPAATRDTYLRMDYYRAMDVGFWRSFVEGGTYYDSLWAQPAPSRVRHGDFYLTARWRKETPELSVGDYDDVIRQADETPLPDGTRRLRVVDAGSGSPADFARIDSRGKLVVVRRTADMPGRDQAAAATAAGATMLLVINDGPGRSVGRYGPTVDTRTPIEVALVSADEGERLLAALRRGPVTLPVTASAASTIAYDLVQTYHNEIPATLARRVDPAQLARIPVDFTQPRPSTGGEFRFDWPRYNEGWGIGELSSRPLPEHRTDYVSTGGPYRWGQEAYVNERTVQIDRRIAYSPGPAPRETFFGPIERPHLNDNYRQPVRDGDRMTIDIPGWGGDDHVGLTQNAAAQTIAVYQGANLLGRDSGTFTTVTAAVPEPRPYRVVVHTDQDPSAGPLSRSSDTTWSFRSAAAPSSAVLPLLQLEYAVHGDRLAVSAVHLPEAVGAGRVLTVALDVSYDDGRHWSRAPLVRGTAPLRAPRSAAYTSIRATATDTAGNAVTQTVIRALRAH